MYDLLSQEGYFATIILGKYWPLKGSMHLANAGHLPPIRITYNNEIRDVSIFKGLPVGIDKNVRYRRTELTLLPDESIIFLTDGITEAENEGGDLFGIKRIESCIIENKVIPAGTGLVKKVKEWRGSAEINDDLTILEIWR
jgi:serine phosphatase RsbU (regulator of sigma subunit)